MDELQQMVIEKYRKELAKSIAKNYLLHDNKCGTTWRFSFRIMGDEFQVYDYDMRHICMCTNRETAAMIVDVLETFVDLYVERKVWPLTT